MAKAAKKTAGFGIPELDALGENELKGLRVMNVSPQVIAVGGGAGAGDIVLAPFAETIVPAASWVRNRFFRELVTVGKFEIAPADVYDTPKVIPTLDAAPTEAQPETGYDLNYARQILSTDTTNALDMIRDEVLIEDGSPNVKFLKGRKLKILKCVEWAEPQMQNRKLVLSAVKDEIGKIRAL